MKLLVFCDSYTQYNRFLRSRFRYLVSNGIQKAQKEVIFIGQDLEKSLSADRESLVVNLSSDRKIADFIKARPFWNEIYFKEIL